MQRAGDPGEVYGAGDREQGNIWHGLIPKSINYCTLALGERISRKGGEFLVHVEEDSERAMRFARASNQPGFLRLGTSTGVFSL